jgi:hypothetical protein
MKSKLSLLGMIALVLTWGAGLAQAGAIRTTAKQVGKGSATVVKSAPEAAGNVADGLATAGKATGGAVTTTASSVGKGVAATPGIAARGTARGLKAVGKAIW